MVQNLYLCVAVVLRVVGLLLVGSFLIRVIFAAVLSGLAPILPIAIATTPVLASGLLLWIFAKPAARLITNGLND